jgi:DNA-binding MurR/RpiR family transcriptional regulator
VRYCFTLGAGLEELSIHELAERQDVSAAMIVKLAQRLGYSGFREMKQALVAYSHLPIGDLHSELNPNDNSATVVDKVFKTATYALHETQAVLDLAALEKAANALRAARTIDLYGAAGSGAMAADAYHRFLRIGVRTSVITDSHLMIMSASLLGPESAVLGFSHSGHTLAVTQAFARAQQQGATTILITNTAHSPTSKCSDIVLCSIAQGSPITGENAAARVAQLCIFDALFVLVAQRAYDQSLDNLEKTISAVASMRT